MASGAISQTFSRAVHTVAGSWYGGSDGNWQGEKNYYLASTSSNWLTATFVQLGTIGADEIAVITSTHWGTSFAISNTAGVYRLHFSFDSTKTISLHAFSAKVDLELTSKLGTPNIGQNDWFAIMFSADFSTVEPTVSCWVHKVGEPEGWNAAVDYVNLNDQGPLILQDYQTAYLIDGDNNTSNDEINLSQFVMDNNFIDWDDENERSKFVNRQGCPVDLGATGELLTGSQPRIFLPDGDGANNIGWEPNFSYLYDSPSVSASSPSDGAVEAPFLYQKIQSTYTDVAGVCEQTLPVIGQAAAGAEHTVGYQYGRIQHGLYRPPYQISAFALNPGYLEPAETEGTLISTTSLWAGSSSLYTSCLAMRFTPPEIPGSIYGPSNGEVAFWYNMPGFVQGIYVDTGQLIFDIVQHRPLAAQVVFDVLSSFGIKPGDWFVLMLSFDGSLDSVVERAYIQKIGSSTAYDLFATAVINNPPPNGSVIIDYDVAASQSFPRMKRADQTAQFAMAHIWVDDVYTDFSDETNRFRYIDDKGYLQDLGTTGADFNGIAPRFWAPNGDLTNNQGTAASFVESETASSIPADSPTDNGLVSPFLTQSSTGTAFYDVSGSIEQTFESSSFSVAGKQILSLTSDMSYYHSVGQVAAYPGSSYITLACYLRVPNSLGGRRMIFHDNVDFAGGRFYFYLDNWVSSSNNFVLEIGDIKIATSNALATHGIAVGDWFAFMFNIDLATNWPNETIEIWVQKVGDANAIDILPIATVTGTLSTSTFNWKGEGLGGDLIANFIEERGDCEYSVFYAHNEYVDWSNSAERLKFISASGYPVSLGADGSDVTGTQPPYFFKNGDGTDNLGYHGNMTEVNGPILDSSTSPTDGTVVGPISQAMTGLLDGFSGPVAQAMPIFTSTLAGTAGAGTRTGSITQTARSAFQHVEAVNTNPVWSGVATQALTFPTMAAAGTYFGGLRDGAITQEAPFAVQALTGAVFGYFTGQTVQVLPAISQNMTGEWLPGTFTGAVTQAFLVPLQVATATYVPKNVTSSVNMAAPFPIQSMMGRLPTGIVAQAIVLPSQSLHGLFFPGDSIGTIEQIMPIVNMALAGNRIRAGIIIQNLSTPTQLFVGTVKFATNIGSIGQSLLVTASVLGGTFGPGISTSAIAQNLFLPTQVLRGVYDIPYASTDLIWEQRNEEFISERGKDSLIL